MKWLSIAHKVLQLSAPTNSTVSDPIFWVLQPTHTRFAFDSSSGFCLCPKFDCLTITHTQDDEVLIKLSSCGGKVKVQLLANQAAVAQVSADANLLFVVDPLMQLTGRSLCCVAEANCATCLCRRRENGWMQLWQGRSILTG